MMFRAIVVEDEPWTLRWISNTFKWEKMGFELIAQTLDPEEAFQIICSERPDVVFTDIRMPEISGLDLMKMTREKGIDTEFVIISRFAEFSYAQQAIRQGAFDYRLKPVQKDEAEELLKNLYTFLEDKWSKQYFDVLESLMGNGCNIGEIVGSRGLDNTGAWYQSVIIISTEKSDKLESPFNNTGISSLEFNLGPRKKLYITNSNHNINEDIIKYYSNLPNCNGVCIGLSRQSENLSEISRLIKEADLASNSDFIYDRSDIFYYKKSNFSIVKNILEKIFSAMDTGLYNDAKVVFEKVPELFISNQLGMDEVVYFWNQVVTYVTETYKDRSSAYDLEYMNCTLLLEKFSNLKAVAEYLSKLFYLFSAIEINIIENKEINVNFEKLLEYVNKNYHQKLHLKELAGKYFINFTYCSELFKKYTGSTFSEYTTALRMKKSRELLENRSLTIEQICEYTGYGDYFYFNSIFKKYHGLTPSQYRKGCSNSTYKQKEVVL
jgi:two-component system, response regulator YesN